VSTMLTRSCPPSSSRRRPGSTPQRCPSGRPSLLAPAQAGPRPRTASPQRGGSMFELRRVVHVGSSFVGTGQAGGCVSTAPATIGCQPVTRPARRG
jgi:hypothetical protein